MQISRYWRLKQSFYRLVGVVCENCAAKVFPPREICPNCGSKVEIECVAESVEIQEGTGVTRERES